MWFPLWLSFWASLIFWALCTLFFTLVSSGNRCNFQWSQQASITIVHMDNRGIGAWRMTHILEKASPTDFSTVKEALSQEGGSLVWPQPVRHSFTSPPTKHVSALFPLPLPFSVSFLLLWVGFPLLVFCPFLLKFCITFYLSLGVAFHVIYSCCIFLPLCSTCVRIRFLSTRKWG